MEADSVPFDPDALLEHVEWVRALARRLVADADAAEDLVQETWLSALRARPDAGQPLRPWLARVVRNAARFRRRSEGHRALRERAAARPEAEPSAAELAGTLETHRLLVDLVLALREPWREALILRYFRGRTSAEIARALALPESTVRTRVQTGLDQLRARLDARHGGERSAWCALLAPLCERPAPGVIVPAGAAASTYLQGAWTVSTAFKLGIAAAVAVAGVVVVWKSPWTPAQRGPVDRRAIEVAYAPVERAAPVPLPAVLPVAADRVAVPSRSGALVTPDSVATATPPVEVRARALDARGAPLFGATLRCIDADAPPSAPSGSDGELALGLALAPRAEPPTAAFELACPGFASTRRAARVAPGETVWLGDVELGPGGDVAGTVVDPAGRGIAGAVVAAAIGPEEMKRAEHFGVLYEAPSAASTENGSFALRGLPAGYVVLLASAEGRRSALTEPLEVRAGEAADGVVLELAGLAPADSITGVVLFPDGEPVPWAWIQYREPTGSGSFQAGADGRFRHLVARAGAHAFTAHDPAGRFPAVSVAGVREGTHDLELRLPAPHEVELVVTGADGAPLARFSAECLAADGDARLSAVEEVEHAGGIARLALPGQAFRLRVTAPGFDVAELGPLAPEEAPARIACVLRALPGIRGVVLADGAPLAGAEVELLRVADERTVADGFLVRLWPFELERVETDEHGEFALTPRESGTYAVLATAAGQARAELSPLAVDPAVGQDGLVLELRLGGAIEGRVHAAPGRSAAGAVVGISRGDGRPRSARTGPDGGFRFEALTSGPWLVELRAEEISDSRSTVFGGPPPDELPSSCTVVEGGTARVDLWLEGAGEFRLAGQLSVDGAAPGPWTAALVAPGAPPFAAHDGVQLDPDGRFALDAAEGGAQRLVLTAPAGPDALFVVFDDVVLERGERAWSCALETGAVEGFAPPQSAEAITCLLWEGPGGELALVGFVPDEDGRFRAPRVPAGELSFVRLGAAQRERFDPRTAPVLAELRVEPGATTPVDLR